jgi:hypothetical protein
MAHFVRRATTAGSDEEMMYNPKIRVLHADILVDNTGTGYTVAE